LKYEVPDSCKIKISKHTKIEKLQAKFVLIAHPFPSFEGELLIIQPKKLDQEEKGDLVHRDFSLRKRLAAKDKNNTDSKIRERKKKENE
jgi:hypothetical protein